MHTSDDMQLLQEYAGGRSEEAFAALVARHINLVYSAAMRSVNNPQQAEEITQSVFVTLARKCRELRRGTVLSGWLYQTARLTAANFIRTETRRQHREQQAHIESTMNEPDPETWTSVGPLLDEAMAQLNEKDRNAIVLRFFEGKALKEVGHALGSSEEAAQVRVSRALDKLRIFFHKRGITMPAAALAAAISGGSVQAAPMGLAAAVASAASGAAQASTAAVSTLTLIKGAMSMMTSTKIGVAIGLCAAAAVIGLQHQQISIQKQTVQQLQTQVTQMEPQAQTNLAMRAQIEKLQAQNASYAKTMESMQRDVAKARAHASSALAAKAAATSAAAAAAKAKGNPLAEMLKDPDMMAAMKDQQMSMMKMQFAPFVKQINLSPEQADKFYQILSDQTAKGMEALQTGKVDSGKDTADALQSLLGDSGMAQYKDFTESMAETTMLSLYKNNFTDNPLTDAQQQQLLQVMKSARKSVTASSPLDASGDLTDQVAVMGKLMKQQEQINQNVLQQASSFLSADQLQTLGTSQSNMLGMQKFGMTMAQKMFTNAPAGQ